MKIPTNVKVLLFVLLLIPIGLGLGALYVLMQIPSDKEIRGCLVTKMYNVKLCPGSKDYVPLSRISGFMKKTVVLTEDSSFYQHNGFDWQSIEKSARENLEKGSYVRGGSTITQQLAKNMFLSKEKSIWRKFIESLITIRLESVLSKNEILERYLNVIEYGKGIFGIKAAANHYFKKSANDLTAAESAFLAMLLPSPVKYSASFRRKELSRFAENRIRRILKDMYQYERIDQETYESALVQMLFLFSPEQMDLIAPTFDEFDEESGLSILKDGGEHD